MHFLKKGIHACHIYLLYKKMEIILVWACHFTGRQTEYRVFKFNE